MARLCNDSWLTHSLTWLFWHGAHHVSASGLCPMAVVVARFGVQHLRKPGGVASWQLAADMLPCALPCHRCPACAMFRRHSEDQPCRARDSPDANSTPDRPGSTPQTDPGSIIHRHQIDLGSTPNRPRSDPKWTSERPRVHPTSTQHRPESTLDRTGTASDRSQFDRRAVPDRLRIDPDRPQIDPTRPRSDPD